MINFFLGFGLSTILVTIVAFIIANSTKEVRRQQSEFHKYYVIDDLWLKTGISAVINSKYNYKNIALRVKCNDVNGTEGTCRLYSVFINDVLCATAVTLRDGYSKYYAFHVLDEYDEDETWNIIEHVYNDIKDNNSDTKTTPKKSILEV